VFNQKILLKTIKYFTFLIFILNTLFSEIQRGFFRGNIMSIYEYDEINVDDEPYLDTGISGFEIAYGSSNKSIIKRKVKNKLKTKRKLDMINEQRRLAQDIDTLYDRWEH
jgi:hypothetical protein